MYRKTLFAACSNGFTIFHIASNTYLTARSEKFLGFSEQMPTGDEGAWIYDYKKFGIYSKVTQWSIVARIPKDERVFSIGELKIFC